jgi:hypothetical protein
MRFQGKTVRYFECQPGAGSFIKPSKANSGTDLLSAIKERYSGTDDASDETAMYANTATGKRVGIEIVGMQKIQAKQNVSLLRIVSLEGRNVSSAGGDGELAKVAPNIIKLNLQNNLLYDWDEVATLGMQLSQLEVLELSGNRFIPLPKLTPVWQPQAGNVFGCLRVLILNATKIQWSQIEYFSSNGCFPELEELHMCANLLSSFGNASAVGALAVAQDTAKAKVDPILSKLKHLDLSDNCISSWEQLEPIGRLPNLQKLLVNSNQLSCIPPRTPSLFENLQSLSISYNRVAEWRSIDEINSYPNLAALRCQHNPLMEGIGSGEARQIIIARLSALQQFNGSEVRLKERVDSEKAYVFRVWCELNSDAAAAAGDKAELTARVLEAHPRYQSLLEVHGSPEGRNKMEDGSTTLGSRLVCVNLQSMAMASITATPIKQRLPLSMKVKELKMLCSRKFKKAPPLPNMLLSIVSAPGELPVTLESDDQELAYYGLQQESTILMNELDAKALERAAEDEGRKQEQLLQEQMKEAEKLRVLKESQLQDERTSVEAAAKQ